MKPNLTAPIALAAPLVLLGSSALALYFAMKPTAPIVLWVAACTSSPPLPIGVPLSAEDAFSRQETALGSSIDGGAAFGPVGRYRVLHGATACDGDDRSPRAIGNPLVFPDRRFPPIAGRRMRVEWTTTPSSPYAKFAVAYVLLAFGAPESVPIGKAGFPGCWSHVGAAPIALVPQEQGALRMRDGTVALDLEAPAWLAGREMRLQLLGWDGAAWRWSPGLEVWVGG